MHADDCPWARIIPAVSLPLDYLGCVWMSRGFGTSIVWLGGSKRHARCRGREDIDDGEFESGRYAGMLDTMFEIETVN